MKCCRYTAVYIITVHIYNLITEIDSTSVLLTVYMRLYWANWPTWGSASSHHLWYHISNITHKSWLLWTQILYLNQFMYQTKMVYETTKFTQQSVGTVPSIDGCMSVLNLNAGPNISVCCTVYRPGHSAYQLHSHYHYHHPYLLLLLFPYQFPSPVCCPMLSAQLTACVSLKWTHTFSFSQCNNRCCDDHVTVLTAVTLSDSPPKAT